MPKPIFKRVLLKLSGEALQGDQGYGISPPVLESIASQIKDVVDLGVELGIVIGGGNIFRGVAASAQGMDRVPETPRRFAGPPDPDRAAARSWIRKGRLLPASGRTAGHYRGGKDAVFRNQETQDGVHRCPAIIPVLPRRSSSAAPAKT